MADATFGVCAYLDENENGQVDPKDSGLEGLTFTMVGWGDQTGGGTDRLTGFSGYADEMEEVPKMPSGMRNRVNGIAQSPARCKA